MGTERETQAAAPVAEPALVATPEALPAGFSPETILSLQRTAGNVAVTRYLARQAAGAPAPSAAPAAPQPSGPSGVGKAQEIAYEIPRKPVPGSPFAIAGKLQLSVALSGAPVKAQSGDTEVTVGSFKDEEVKQKGQKFLRAFAGTLAKLDWTAAEPIPGVKVSGSIELLEAKLEAGDDVDVSLVKASAEISGDLLKIAASVPGGAGELQPLVDRGAEIKVSGVVEVGLDPTAASQLAKAQAAKVRAEKLADEATELAKRNQKAAGKLQQQIAGRDAALKRGKVRGKGGRLRALSKADRAKLAKEIADRKAELGKLKDALKAKEAAAKVAKSELDDAMAGLSKGIGKRWGEAIKKALGKRLLKLAGALGIVMTLIDIAIFVHAVAKAGIDPGFHDKGDSGTPGGDPNAAPSETPGEGGGGGAGGEYDIDADGGLSDDERVDVTEEATAALHPAAQQLVEALYGEDAGAKVSPGQLEVFNQLVPEDLTPEEVELVIQRVKGSGADAGGVQVSVAKAVQEVRRRQTIAAGDEPAPPPGGAAPAQPGTGPRTGDQPGPMQGADQPAVAKPGEKVLDVQTLQFKVVAGIDPDRTYAPGQQVTMSIVFEHDFETLGATFPARVVSQAQTATEDVFTLENAAEWRKAKRDGVEVFMAAGALFSTRWARK